MSHFHFQGNRSESIEMQGFQAKRTPPNLSSLKNLFRLGGVVHLVPVVGLEPTRCCHRRILNPLRLPIPSHRQIPLLLYRTSLENSSAFLRRGVSIRTFYRDEGAGFTLSRFLEGKRTRKGPCITSPNRTPPHFQKRGAAEGGGPYR